MPPGTEDSDLVEHILNHFPSPIAINYKRVMDHKTWESKTRQCIRLFEFTLRAFVLILVGQYLIEDRERFSDRDLNRVLYKISKPSLGALVEILFTGLNAYSKHAMFLFMPELKDFYWDDEKKAPRRGIRKPFIRLVEIRNEIAHRLPPRNEEGWRELFQEVHANLLTIYDKLQFLQNYDLIYISHRKGTSHWYTRHRGLRAEDIREPLIHDPAGEEGWYFLADASQQDRRLLRLYPYVIPSEKDIDSDLPGLQVDAGVLDRFTTTKVYYLATILWEMIERQDKQLLDSFFYNFRSALEEKRVQAGEALPKLQPLSWRNLQEAAITISEQRMGDALNKYDPELYLQRESILREFHQFLQSDKTCLVIIGKSGVGKTNFVVAMTEAFRQSDQACPLLYNGARLPADKDLTDVITEDLARHLDLSSIHRQQGRSLWDALDGLKELDQRQVLVFIDAINENMEAARMLTRVNQLVEAETFSWLKILVTSRPEAWRRLTRNTNLGEHRYYWQPDKLELGVELTEFSTADPITLEKFVKDELEDAYRNYQFVYHLDTDFTELPPALRQELRDPLVLRLVAETYGTRSEMDTSRPRRLPDRLAVSQVYADYLKALKASGRLFEEDLRLIKYEIVPRMLVIPDNKLDEDEIMSEKSLAERILNEDVLASGKPVNASFANLADSEILDPLSELEPIEVRFRYERMYDYFIGDRLFHDQTKTSDLLHYYLTWVDKTKDYPFLWGGTKNALLSEIQHGKEDLIYGLGFRADEYVAEMLTAVLSEYGKEAEQPVVERILLQLLGNKGERNAATEYSARIAIQVAYRLKIEEVLLQAARFKNESLQNAAVRHIFYWWQQDHEAGSRILDRLSINDRGLVGLPRFGTINARVCATLTAAIIFSDPPYESIVSLQKTWQNILESLYVVPKEKGVARKLGIWFRLPLLWLVSNVVIAALRTIEGSGVGNFNLRELELFFSRRNDRSRFIRLIPHIEGRTAQLETIREDLIRVVEEPYSITFMATIMALEASMFKKPRETMPFAEMIFTRALEVAEDSGGYPGPYFLVVILTVTETIAKLGDSAPPEFLERLRYFIETYQTKYNCFYYGARKEKGKPVRISRFSQLGRYMDLYYLRHQEIDEELANLFLNQAQQRDDLEGVFSYIDLMRYTGGREYTETAVARILSLNLVLEKINQTHQGQDAKTWWKNHTEEVEEAVVNALATLHTHFPNRIEEYLYDEEICQLPKGHHDRVRSREGKERAGDLLESGASQWVVKNILLGENQFLLRHMKWLLYQAATASSLSALVRTGIKMFINMVYDDFVFDTGQPMRE